MYCLKRERLRILIFLKVTEMCKLFVRICLWSHIQMSSFKIDKDILK